MWHMRQICVIFLIAAIQYAHADYYSANSELARLLELEKFMVDNVEGYLNAEQQRISHLRNFIGHVQQELVKAENDSVAYFGNPLNAWKAIKRMTREWRDFYYENIGNKNAEEYQKRITAYESASGIRKAALDDLLGAAKGIARLQHTYNLDTSHLANGTLVGRKVSLEMTAADCYDLGMSLINSKDLKYGESWLLEARGRLAQETQNAMKLGVANFPYLQDYMILDNLVPAVMQNGNTRLALWLIKEQLTKNPENQNALQNHRLIEQQLRTERLAMETGGMRKPAAKPLTIFEMYEKTCSGELKQTPREQRKLRCRYAHNNVPFCFIAPFKLEELSLAPYVAYYYEALYEIEIEKILAAAASKVERSVTGSNKSTVSDYRTSKNTWLRYDQHGFLASIEQRLTDITGLSLSTAEALQVANYGIGGHYGPHYDFNEEKNFDYNGKGNRILTVLFYINDVELGGATAFPFLRLAVPPIKRSLVIWYNLHRSLELDYRTKHAGCPVIKGSKWICNEWYHTLGQEFYRPCGLKSDGYISEEFKNFR